MSGDPTRLTTISAPPASIMVKGFNNTSSSVAATGFNTDSKPELYVPGMPEDLVLLCAADYTNSGATILLPNEGYVLSLSPEQQHFLREFAQQNDIIKTLTVNNNTYEVAPDPISSQVAYNSTATKYFNSKVNVSTAQERILSTLLTGLTFRDLLFLTNNEAVSGLPRDLTATALHSFENKYGRTPDVLQLAFPDLSGNAKGYFAPKPILTHCGQRIEADFFEPEFNDLTSIDETSEAPLTSTQRAKLRKIKSFGGAIAGYAYIDVYTGCADGILVNSMAKPLPLVKATVQSFKAKGHKVEVFSADQGVISQSLFRVAIPEVQKYLREDENIVPECGEAYNHNNGTPYIEHLIRQIKELQRFAVLYILRNPNFKDFKFTRVQIFKLWGELYYWALMIINLKPAFNDPKITKYQAFHQKKPDLRIIRLLPIFSVLYVYRHAANDELNSQHDFWQLGLYVGPSSSVPGAIRAAVLINKRLHIITTTAIKGVSDGGHVAIYPTSDSSIECLLEKQAANAEEPLQILQFSEEPAVPASQIPLSRVPHVQQFEPASSPVPAASPAVQFVPVSTPSDAATDSSNSSNPTAVYPSATVVVPSISTVAHIDPVSPFPISDPVPSSTSTTFPAPTSAPVAPSSSRSKKSKQAPPRVSARTAIPPADTELERLRKNNRARRQQLNEDMNSRIQEPLLVSAPLASSAELLAYSAVLLQSTPQSAHFVDWSNHIDDADAFYFSFQDNAYIQILSEPLPEDSPPMPSTSLSVEGYRAITENVPKTFPQALRDPVWGDPARLEFETILTTTKSLVRMDTAIARQHIQQGAEVLYMIPVYEEKMKEGKLVRKVRLVVNGKHHNKHGSTFASTPSREEFLILMHLFAALDCDFYHIDENRAFLNAPKLDQIRTIARIPGDPAYYEILNALYGLKTSSHDYQEKNIKRMELNNFTRLHLCSSIYYKFEDNKLCIAYSHVDDFLFGGTDDAYTQQQIIDFRKLASTSEPVKNPAGVLGYEIERDRERKLIKVTNKAKINEVASLFPQATKHKRNVPIPTTGYLVHDSDFEQIPANDSAFLTKPDITLYMQLVGVFIWIQGVRPDVLFAVLYLSWFTQKPRQHHLNMAYYVLGYLYTTQNIPLVLGGTSPVSIRSNTDASLATGPRRRSILGSMVALGLDSGAVHAKATTSGSTCLSSFEAELDGLTTILKSVIRIRHILQELLPEFTAKGIIFSDNEALVNFVNGDGPMAKGVRHIEIRQWFTRDTIQKGQFELIHMPGKEIPADKLTKLGNVSEHEQFRSQILGLSLLLPA